MEGRKAKDLINCTSEQLSSRLALLLHPQGSSALREGIRVEFHCHRLSHFVPALSGHLTLHSLFTPHKHIRIGRVLGEMTRP